MLDRRWFDIGPPFVTEPSKERKNCPSCERSASDVRDHGGPAFRKLDRPHKWPLWSWQRYCHLHIATFKGFLLGVLLSLVIFAGTRQALAEVGDELSELKKDVAALKQGQLQLQRELQEINALLRRRQPSATDVQNLVLSIDGYPSKGSQSAKLILIEFTDYQCPFCSRYVQQTR